MRYRPAFANDLNATAQQVRFDRRDVALYWGYVQGMELRALHERYFDGEPLADLRHVRARARAIAQDLAAAVRRTDRPELAGLFLRDPRAIVDAVGQGASSTQSPSLEDYRASVDPDGYYSESELIRLWSDAHAQPGRDGQARLRGARERSARLLARIRDGIAWVESRGFAGPELHHRVDAWLPLVYARRLEAVGLLTIAQLVVRINAGGLKWYRGIAGIGAVKAREIEQWVMRHEQKGEIQLLASAKMTPRQIARQELMVVPATEIVPLDRIRLPSALDGAAGRFRGPGETCTLSASNDLEAIRAWIRSKASLHTQRAYTREAERLLLWCLVELGKPVSSLTVEDCERYRQFLRDPQPAQRWCAPRGTPRWSRAWRPFEAPLGNGAQRQALTILKSMATWLREQNYLIANSWAGIGLAGSARRPLDRGRAFTPAQWELIAEELELLDDVGARPRLKFALWFLYGTGLRLSEAVGCRIRDLQPTALSDGTQVWQLHVVGKRGKLRLVPVASAILERLDVYLDLRGYPSFLVAAPEMFLLGRAVGEGARLPQGLVYEPGGGIADGTLYRQLKGFFRRVAKRCANDEAQAAAQLRRASTHWLRHTFGTRIVALTRAWCLPGICSDMTRSRRRRCTWMGTRWSDAMRWSS